MAKKVKLGNILQVLTSQGVAYAQVTHKHPEFDFLIRVFSGFYNKQPKVFSTLIEGKPQFSAFFVAQSAVNQGLLSVVENISVPERLKIFPTFRSRNGGAGGSLWLWDGKESFRREREFRPNELEYPTSVLKIITKLRLMRSGEL